MTAHREPSRFRARRQPRKEWAPFVENDDALRAVDEELREIGYARSGLVRVSVSAKGTATYRFAWRRAEGDVRFFRTLTIRVAPT